MADGDWTPEQFEAFLKRMIEAQAQAQREVLEEQRKAFRNFVLVTWDGDNVLLTSALGDSTNVHHVNKEWLETHIERCQRALARLEAEVVH